MEDEWNEVLEAYARKEVEFLSERSEYTLTYEVTAATEELLSVVYRIDYYEPGAARPFKSMQTFNIDLTTGKEWRLKDFISLERVVECLETGEFELLNTQISKKDFQEYLSINPERLTVDEFEAYDLDSANIRDYIPGYSYRLDDHVVVCMEVAGALGDYVEVLIQR